MQYSELAGITSALVKIGCSGENNRIPILSFNTVWWWDNMLVETYAAMLNRKIVIPSSKTHYVAVEKSYWTEFFGIRIANVDLDAAWYLDRYPDVAKAIEDKILASPMEHYCQSGYFEHRMPYYISVDPTWYIEQYADVREAIENKVFSSAQDHFELIGFKEGRYPFPSFALRKKSEAGS